MLGSITVSCAGWWLFRDSDAQAGCRDGFRNGWGVRRSVAKRLPHAERVATRFWSRTGLTPPADLSWDASFVLPCYGKNGPGDVNVRPFARHCRGVWPGRSTYLVVDAHFEKVRREGRVLSTAVLWVIGISETGYGAQRPAISRPERTHTREQ